MGDKKKEGFAPIKRIISIEGENPAFKVKDFGIPSSRHRQRRMRRRFSCIR